MRRRWVRAAGRRNPVAWRIAAADKLFLAGRYDRAEPRLAGVVAELEGIHAEVPDDAETVALLASTSYLLGVCRHRLDRYEEAAAALRLSMDLLTPLHTAEAAAWGRQLASATQEAADVERDLGHWPQALELSRRALDLASHALAVVAVSATIERATIRTFADVRAKAGVELDEALERVDEAIAGHTALLATQPGKQYRHEIDESQLVRTKVLEAMIRRRSASDGGIEH